MRTSDVGRGRTLLEGAIKVFRSRNPELLEDEDAVLSRLSVDRRAVLAFAALPEQHRGLDLLIQDCVMAAEIFRILDREVARSEWLLGTERKEGELDRLKKGLIAFEKFLDGLQSQPVGRVTAQHILPPKSLDALRASLLFARDVIEGQRRIAKETPRRLGATRKSRGRGAAELAAIGWLAEGVRRAAGRAGTTIAAQLAEVVLQINVTEARVREAERTRRERDWRMPLRSIEGQKPALGTVLVSSRRQVKSSRSSAVARQARLHERTKSK